ncbi:MAG TPA: hypothetical protein VHC43_17845 [Mycobacteriales bacterium]|nr:hypothetical protein [Mycobacteriales bacterium]
MSETQLGEAGDRPDLIHRLETLVARPVTTNGESGLPVGPVVAASLTGLRAEMTELEERLATIEDTVDALSDRLESRIASLDDRLAALLQSMNSERAAAAQHRERTSEALQEQAGALDEWAEAVRAGLEDLGEAVASSLGTLGETLQDPASRDADRRHIEALVTEVLTAIDESTRPIDAQLSSLQGGILDGFAESRDRLLEDLSGVLASMERASVETRDNVELQLTELRNDFADALDEVREHVDDTVGSSSRDVATALGELRSDWSTRADIVVSEGRAAAAGVLDDVQATLAEQASAIGSVSGTIGSGTERLIAAGQALLAYLADRDRTLERERDRVLHDVLEEFAAGLAPRERRAVASRVGEAVDRRRDSRDAARYRRDQVDRPEPDVPSLPGVLARLSEPVPAPAPSRAPARRAGLRPIPKTAPARKASPKSAETPAKAASKAPAKPATKAAKTPAKAPAKAAAKNASPTKKSAPARKRAGGSPSSPSATRAGEPTRFEAGSAVPDLPVDES